ncbi:hypothetical protein [Pseudomonas sp. NPDC089406]|uniref:hypothetical protein n=1 Tax=Pseudomonas sp. NPDC089406 TaxID=3364463 RepID=UPI00384E17F4
MHLDAESVYAYLAQACMMFGVTPEEVFITQVVDLIDEQVVSSRSLVDEVFEHLVQGEEPTYDQGLSGIFSQPDTFDPGLRLQGVRLPDVERFIGTLLMR